MSTQASGGKCPKGRRFRTGVTAVEVVVSAALVVAGFGLMSSLASRIVQLGKEERYYRLASQELANQLERITNLPDAEVAETLEQLEVSERLRDILPSVRMSGKRISDDDGKRIVLFIDWHRGAESKPLSMMAWIAPGHQDGNAAGEGVNP